MVPTMLVKLTISKKMALELMLLEIKHKLEFLKTINLFQEHKLLIMEMKLKLLKAISKIHAF